MIKKWRIVFAGEVARNGEASVCGRCKWRNIYPRCPAHPGEPGEDVEFELGGAYVLATDYLDEWRERFEAPTDEDTWLDSTVILCDKFEEWGRGERWNERGRVELYRVWHMS